MPQTKFPLVISLALSFLADFVSSDYFRRGRSKGIRAMRCDYMKHMLAVLKCLVQCSCLKFDGMCCRVKDGRARAIVVAEIAELSGVKSRTVERCLHDLRDMGFLETEDQFRKVGAGGIMVAAAARKLTQKFWNALGLWEKFVEGVKYACAHTKLVFKRLIKFIPKTKIEGWKDSFLQAFNKCHQKREASGPQSVGLILQQLSLRC